MDTLSGFTIEGIDCVPQPDPFNDNRTPTSTVLVVSPQNRSLLIEQQRKTGGTDYKVFLRHRYEFWIKGHPKQQWLEEFITKNIGVFERIADGHVVRWNGSNHVGVLSDDGKDALHEIEYQIERAFDLSDSYYKFWDIEDWFRGGVPEVGADSTDEELKELALRLESEAEAQHVVMNHEILSYLEQVRASKL